MNGALSLGNDDTFASGHYNPNDKFTPDPDRLSWDTADTFGISVKNHLGWTAGAGNGVRIGGGGGYTQKDFTFENVNYVGFKNLGITLSNFTADTKVKFTDATFDTSKVTTNASIGGRGSSASDRFGSLILDDVWFSHNLPINISNTTDLRIHDLSVAGTPVTRLTQFALKLTNVVNRDFDFIEDVAPVFGTIPTSEIEVGTELVLPIPVSDGDGDTVQVSSPSLPEGATITDNALHWTPTSAQAGTTSIPLLATDSHGATATGSATVKVIDPDAERIEIPVAADTNVQTWNAEQTLNYGDGELLRMLNFNDANLGGVLGEKYAGNQSNRDSKLSLLSFELGDLGERIAAGELLSAELTMTYAGPAKGGLSGSNSLVAALATPGWIEGDGKSTPPARTNTVDGAVTWLTKPAIDTTVTATSAPFDVTSPNKVGSDASYSATQKPVGSKATIDVLPLVTRLAADASAVSFAVNETKRQDLLFVSREGGARNPNAEGLAPRLTLTFAAPTVVDEVAPSERPSISGQAVVGETLAAESEGWPEGTSLTYEWAVDGVPVGARSDDTVPASILLSAAAAQTGDQFVIPADAVGSRITVTVTGSLEGFRDGSVTSDPTAAVRAATVPGGGAGPGTTPGAGGGIVGGSVGGSTTGHLAITGAELPIAVALLALVLLTAGGVFAAAKSRRVIGV